MQVRTQTALSPQVSPQRLTSNGTMRRRINDLRGQLRRAVSDNREQPLYLLDGMDMEFLASLPRNMPRGSLVNVLI